MITSTWEFNDRGEEVPFNEATQKDIQILLEKSRGLKMMLRVWCHRRILHGPFNWTIKVGLFADASMAMDLDYVSEKMLHFIRDSMKREEFLVKKNEMFGNSLTFTNFCYDESIQQVADDTSAPFLLLLRIFLLESLKLEDPKEQRDRIAKAVMEVLPRDKQNQEPVKSLLSFISSENFKFKNVERSLNLFFGQI